MNEPLLKLLQPLNQMVDTGGEGHHRALEEVLLSLVSLWYFDGS